MTSSSTTPGHTMFSSPGVEVLGVFRDTTMMVHPGWVI